MLKDAKVTTSKFLQLRDSLNANIQRTRGYDNSSMRAYDVDEIYLKVEHLQKAFNELCELLHELVMEEDNKCRKGEGETHKSSSIHNVQCSRCSRTMTYKKYDCCPYCGARDNWIRLNVDPLR